MINNIILHSDFVLIIITRLTSLLPDCTTHTHTHTEKKKKERERLQCILETMGDRWMRGWMDAPDGLPTTTHNGS